MCKRSSEIIGEACSGMKYPRHWSLGLLGSMSDPKSVVKKTDRIVVIRDKYPKAKKHFLVLPEDEINSIYDLDKSHLNLLDEFGEIFEELVEQHGDTLQAGFHAVPSMQRLHMHVISKDMISPCLKTKIHWNSFTTKFFIPYTDLVKQLKEEGCIKKMPNDIHKELMSTPLQCNQCTYQPKNMPQLKEHLLTHAQ